MKKTVFTAVVLLLVLCMTLSAYALKQGDAGDSVRKLQEALLSQGYDTGTPDGQYGPMTERAVSDFRQDHGLTPEGGADEEMMEILQSLFLTDAPNEPEGEVSAENLPAVQDQETKTAGMAELTYYEASVAYLQGTMSRKDYTLWVKSHKITAFINLDLLKQNLPAMETPVIDDSYIKVDINHLPAGVTEKDVVADDKTGEYYVRRDKAEPETTTTYWYIEPTTAGREMEIPKQTEPETTKPAVEPESYNPPTQPAKPAEQPTTRTPEQPATRTPEQPTTKIPEQPTTRTPEQPTTAPHVHEYTATVTVQPTCTTEGIRTYTCTAGDSSYTESIPSTGHQIVSDPAVPATCVSTGLTEGSHCSVCGAVITSQQVIPAAPHTVVTDPGVPASCTQTGLTEGSHCSVCGSVITAQQEIPRSDHVYEEVAYYYIDHYLPPQYVCNACGAHFGTLQELVDYQDTVCGHGSYHVDDYYVDWTEELGETYVPGAYGIYVGDRCINCGTWR